MSQKNELKPWLKKEWCIPPKANVEFVCAMEHVLDVYTWPYDLSEPVVNMDETTKQLTAEVIAPLPLKPGAIERFDTLYRRNGVATLFIFFEPLAGWRAVNIAEGKTRVDWALQIEELLEVRYRDARKVHLVLDNLNIHGGASLYAAFPPEKARRLLSRLEFHYTPKHGSWLNMAEIEFSILSRQCLSRRIADASTLEGEVTAWSQERNSASASVNWRFTTEDARIKLKKLYPTYEC